MSLELTDNILNDEIDDSVSNLHDSEGNASKYIVYQSYLLELFHNCPRCADPTSCIIKHIRGSMLCVQQDCIQCNFHRVWYSQPMIGSIPAGNLAISHALLFSTRRIKEPLCIGRDGRFDSMGHSAKYRSYSAINLESGIIFDVQLVHSNEVKSSLHLEKEGLDRSVSLLKSNGLIIGKIVTDRYVRVKKWVRENLPETKHCVDVWHVAKEEARQIILRKGQWIKSLTDHLYWVAASTPSGHKDQMWEKWTSVGNHI
ncbi:hypothetical protein KUTeg_014388 [Tegillarca granosa]|uniref:Transposase n=1 Tax=Tegillarca granosa TaxID=220873 RepID=A0ABQ9EWE5_TEGGR|nr:hypothetical protein KUTeg_014388 [Tegillarca granosa]